MATEDAFYLERIQKSVTLCRQPVARNICPTPFCLLCWRSRLLSLTSSISNGVVIVRMIP